MDTTNKQHKHLGWIITLIILAAILIVMTVIGPKTIAQPKMMDQTQDQMMNQSDDPQAINSDIDSSLKTDFQTDDLGM